MVDEKPLPTDDARALTPLDIIRTETVLSRLPIHNLSKKGSSISISIIKKNAKGELDLLWKVSPSRDHGEPGQLAYKLDTIIIDRAIEEAGKPLPERIRLGSLREIARELGLGTGNVDKLKKAFLQNTFAGITAKLGYRANDGSEKSLEAAFTRYSVIFAGEKFPDGTRADSVYVILNPTYREVLNNAPMRPLDLGYKKQLAPTPQRFYEIISFRIYNALKYGNAEGRISYSEYCTYSAQQRYFTYDQFKKQMYKVHRPHVLSGYITHVRYEGTRDEVNQPDWMMYYTPGPKAKGEFRTFSRTGRVTSTVKELQKLPPMYPVRRSARQAVFSFTAAEPAVNGDILEELKRRGISEPRAKKVLAELPTDFAVIDTLEWGDEQIRKQPTKFLNPPGFYIYLLRDGVTPPATFETSRRRRLRHEAELAQAAEAQRLFQLEQEYDEYRQQTIDDYLKEYVKPVEHAAMVNSKIAEWRRKNGMLPAETIAGIAQRAARAEFAKLVPLVSFEEFRKQRSGESASR
jgi:hypothetical protein